MPLGACRTIDSKWCAASSKCSMGSAGTRQALALIFRTTSNVPDCDMPEKIPPSLSKLIATWDAMQSGKAEPDDAGKAVAPANAAMASAMIKQHPQDSGMPMLTVTQ